MFLLTGPQERPDLDTLANAYIYLQVCCLFSALRLSFQPSVGAYTDLLQSAPPKPDSTHSSHADFRSKLLATKCVKTLSYTFNCDCRFCQMGVTVMVCSCATSMR